MSNQVLFFSKMHALGNDFVLIKSNLALETEDIARIAHRKLGVGADQILVLNDNREVKIWNTDGSIAKMCGNGLRALAWWIFYSCENRNEAFKEYFELTTLSLRTDSGTAILEKYDDMIELEYPSVAKINQLNAETYMIDVGNLHKIILEEKKQFDLSEYVSKDYNISFVWKITEGYRVRTVERGAYETGACGSAAYAIASLLDTASNEKDLATDIKSVIGKKIDGCLHLPIKQERQIWNQNSELINPNLTITFANGSIFHRKCGNKILQIGPVTFVAQGTLSLSNFSNY